MKQKKTHAKRGRANSSQKEKKKKEKLPTKGRSLVTSSPCRVIVVGRVVGVVCYYYNSDS